MSKEIWVGYLAATYSKDVRGCCECEQQKGWEWKKARETEH